MRGIEWGLPPADNLGSDLWLSPAYQTKVEDQITTEHIQENQFSRADSIEFADQFRSIAFGILSVSEVPLSTTEIHALLPSTNPSLIKQIELRKSSSCMSKMLTGDPQKRFIKYISINKKNTMCFGICGKVYSPEWVIKADTERPIEQSHKIDVIQAENLREYVKGIIIRHGNKPMNTSQILAAIKEENFNLSQELAAKSKNHLVKTIRRDPKKRFNVTKGPAGVLNFSVIL